ncbi:hypothetical protein HBZC1_12040 [Helicobacter bizzozeronii CIII-1]|uniref:Uncharacterized protein n=1 Tax=Helicobacter bizzozeronii (strain CIII-1) TaxID=1002804 RepID=F8KTM0_HELBC|nr:hypothetical protein HBZC1_12040 [Helicobacter bizzozeronii CIII-1]
MIPLQAERLKATQASLAHTNFIPNTNFQGKTWTLFYKI